MKYLQCNFPLALSPRNISEVSWHTCDDPLHGTVTVFRWLEVNALGSEMEAWDYTSQQATSNSRVLAWVKGSCSDDAVSHNYWRDRRLEHAHSVTNAKSVVSTCHKAVLFLTDFLSHSLQTVFITAASSPSWNPAPRTSQQDHHFYSIHFQKVSKRIQNSKILSTRSSTTQHPLPESRQKKY